MEQYAVITGASSGIGKEFAKALSSSELHLVLVARRKDKLEVLSRHLKTKCTIFVADLSREEECYRLYDFIKDKNIALFINNAGFGDCGEFLDSRLNKNIQMLHVNTRAVLILTQLVLVQMQKNDAGALLNVASSAGLLPAGPYMSTYYATKAFVTSFTRGIAKEIKDKKSHVYIGCLCPGPVQTEFDDVANVATSLKGMEVQYCVKYTLKMMKKRRVMIIPGYKMKLVVMFERFLPRKWLIALIAHQQKKKMKKGKGRC